MKRETQIWLAVFVIAGGLLAYRAATGQMAVQYVQHVDGEWATADMSDYVAGTAVPSPSRTIGVWIAALFTLFVFSFLYRDNPLYKLAEAVVVGVSAAYWMVVAFWDVLVPNLFGKIWPAWIQSWAMPGLSPERELFWYMYLIPLALGGMLLWRLAPNGTWIARWPLALIIGTTAGIRLVGFIQADFLSQVRNTVQPLVVVNRNAEVMTFAESLAQIDVWDSIASLLLVIGVLAGLVYFFFSVEHRGVVGKVANVGIWYLMITFGAAFGYTVMGRIALLAIRLEFLFDDWLWLIDPKDLRPPPY